MRVALVGSWKDADASEWGLRDGDKFEEACRDLGAGIARAGHQLVVGGSSPRTADYHAVEGVMEALAARTTLEDARPIIVLRPDDNVVAFQEFRQRNDSLFTSIASPSATWGITKLFQVKRADAVAVIGGADNSYLAGVAAALSGRRIVPVGSFGGAGKRLISLFQASGSQWNANVPAEEQLGILHNPWSQGVKDSAFRLLDVNRTIKILIIHGRSQDRMSLKNFLQNRVGLPEPIILAEQRAVGLTIPEKFERFARTVDGAIALVTPDDTGGLVPSDPGTPPELQQRARQNVWVEVGWFWGRRGRDRVLLLSRGKIDIPSDLDGIIYHPYDSDPSAVGEEIRSFVDALRKLGPP